jgi:two-component system, cell cycle sensor histidine kinase and response regulator CckA
MRRGVVQAEMTFLQKPFTPQALARKIRQVLDQK